MKATAKEHSQPFEKSRDEQMVRVNIINERALCDKTLENATVPFDEYYKRKRIVLPIDAELTYREQPPGHLGRLKRQYSGHPNEYNR